jgi:hypothetical protein
MACALRLPRIKLALQLWSRSLSTVWGQVSCATAFASHRLCKSQFGRKKLPHILTDWFGSQTPVEDDVGYVTPQPDTRLRSVAPTNVLSSFPSGEGPSSHLWSRRIL